MLIRSKVLTLILVVLALWAVTYVWLGQAVRRQHLDASDEMERLFRADMLALRSMAAFDALSDLGRRATVMDAWLDEATTEAVFEARLSEFWRGIDGAAALVASERSRDLLAGLRGAALIWQRDLREILGFGDGRTAPTSFTLEDRSDRLHARMVDLFRLVRAELQQLVENDRETLMSLLARSNMAMAALALVVGAVVMLVTYRITSRIRRLERAMLRMADGDLEATVEDAGRRDEIGRMAAALDVFRRTSLEARSLGEQNAAYERRLIEEHAEAKILEASLAKEREINGLQRSFVAMVSHEFRTPLAIIDASVHRVMRSASLDQNAAGKLCRIRAAVKRLTGLIESVLSLSTLDDGKITFTPGACDLGRMLDEICAEQQEVRAGHRVILDLDALPGSVEGDAAHLHQVFTNLLANAFKYSPDGGDIAVTAAVESRGEGRDEARWVAISVQDSGVGIPEDELPRLFTRFFRARTSAGITGSGIGLHLVRALVEMHGGEISVSSIEGEGSCFTVRLPVSQADRRETPVPAQAAA